jgi:hypothetical protein
MPIQKTDKNFVAGHRGMVGSALVTASESMGFELRALGGAPTIPVRDGIALIYDSFLKNIAQ